MLGYFKAIHCKERGTQKVTCKKDTSDCNGNAAGCFGQQHCIRQQHSLNRA